MTYSVIAVLLQAVVAFTTVSRGADSQIADRREVVVRSADEWRALWKEHGAERVPEVDFSRFMVVGVFLGTRPTAGYATDIVSVRSQGTVTTVEYREVQPARGTLTAQVLTAPFHLVRVPRVTGTIEFRKLAS